MTALPRTVLVLRSSTIDLEICHDFRLEAGQTYHDDGTTIFDVYIHAGLENGSMVPAERDRDTIVVSERTLRDR